MNTYRCVLSSKLRKLVKETYDHNQSKSTLLWQSIKQFSKRIWYIIKL